MNSRSNPEVNLYAFIRSIRKTVAANAVALLLVGAIRCSAHEPGLSTLTVKIGRDNLDVILVLSAKEAGEVALRNVDGRPSDGKGADVVASARAWPGSRMLEVSVDGKSATLGQGASVLDANGNCTLRFVAPGSLGRVLEVRSQCLSILPAGHRQFLSVRAADGAVLAERLLSAGNSSALIEIPAVGLARATDVSDASGLSFAGLGLKHILLGYDHLLFLFSLLVVSRRFMPTLRIVTCFTVAHSITLALSTLDLLAIPSRIVEPLIAASIIYVAVENMVRQDFKRGRMVVVFGFGLIHGLGFASVLRELGVGQTPSDIIVPLLSFNFGVELGQLFVVALVAPVLVWVGRMPGLEKRMIPVSSLVVAGAGLFWLVQRLFAPA